MQYIPKGDNFISVIRTIAKDSYWQSLYTLAKEFHTNLLENSRDYTPIQFTFISYLEFYSSLNMDVAMGEVTDIVFEDELYEDGYAMYRNKSRKDKKKLKAPTEEPTNSWVFKRPVAKKGT